MTGEDHDTASETAEGTVPTELTAAERAVVDRASAWIRGHEEELFDLLSALVARPSVTGAEGRHDDPETAVGTLYQHLAERCDRAALDVQRVGEGDGPVRENCYAVLEGASDELFVCTSHTDTVSAGERADWPNRDPYRLAEGTVRRVGPAEVEVSVGDRAERRTIRDAYDRVWVRRGDGERERAVLVGRGAYDNKSSIVCLVGALAGLERGLDAVDRDLAGTLVHGHLVGEEVSQVGAKAMVGWGDRPDWLGDRYPDPTGAAVVMEGSYGLVPAVGHRGLAWVTVRADGASAHASTPGLGRNAVLGTAKALARTDREAFRTAMREPFVEDRLLGELTIAPGTTIVGGDVHRDRDGTIDRDGVNAVPDWCETTFDVRFPRWEDYPDDHDGIRAELERVVETQAAAASEEVSFAARIDPDEFFPPVAIAESRAAAREHPLVARAIRTTRTVVGYDPGVVIAPGVTDAACIGPATGLPTIVEYGPAGALSHEPLEFVERQSVIAGSEAMAELTVRQLGLA